MSGRVKFVSTFEYDHDKYYEGNMLLSLQVATTSFIREIGLSFTSLVGGTQSLMQTRVQKLLKIAFQDLEKQATAIDSDTIVGVRITMQDIEEQEKPYFTIIVYGTPLIPYRDAPKKHKN